VKGRYFLPQIAAVLRHSMIFNLKLIFNIMKGNGYHRFRTNFILESLLVYSLLCFSYVSYAQSPVNFSGVWIQDTTQSDNFYKSFDVKYAITQTAETFAVKQTFSDYSGNEIVTRDYAFTLDGKETNMEKNGGIEKELAQWSADNKILTTTSTTTYDNQVVGNTAIYSLSEDGLVLTVQNSDIIPGGLSVKQVFNKK
jgi:hypothetical protein